MSAWSARPDAVSDQLLRRRILLLAGHLDDAARAGFSGPAGQLAAAAALHRDEADRLAGLIADATGRNPDRVGADLRAGTVLSATDAIGYGLVHELA